MAAGKHLSHEKRDRVMSQPQRPAHAPQAQRFDRVLGDDGTDGPAARRYPVSARRASGCPVRGLCGRSPGRGHTGARSRPSGRRGVSRVRQRLEVNRERLRTRLVAISRHSVRRTAARWGVVAVCLAAAHPARAAAGWSSATPISSSSAALMSTSISCASASFCVGLDGAGTVITYNGHRWRKGPRLDPAPEGQTYSVSCPSLSFCAAVDGAGRAMTYNRHRWSKPVRVETQDGASLNSVSCPSARFCVAVDSSGNALTYHGRSWSAPHTIHTGNVDVDLKSVSCPSATFCVAIEYKGSRAFVYRRGNWTQTRIGTVLYGVSCASTSFCAAIDDTSTSDVITYNGAHWSRPLSIDRSYLDLEAVSCASASFCLATADTAPDYRYDGRSWIREGSKHLIAPITSVSCPSKSFCAGLDDQGFAYTYTTRRR